MRVAKNITATEIGLPSALAGHTVTSLLARWSEGDRLAAEQLMPLVYEQLREIAERIFRSERQNHTLQATALVHEIYLDLAQTTAVRWESRSHFYGLAACMMRRALVDHSREVARAKRGGNAVRVPLDFKVEGLTAAKPDELIALDEALRDLARLDSFQALVVELRFFGGLTVDEVAECVGSSPRSVARQWRHARAFLYQELRGEEPKKDP